MSLIYFYSSSTVYSLYFYFILLCTPQLCSWTWQDVLYSASVFAVVYSCHKRSNPRPYIPCSSYLYMTVWFNTNSPSKSNPSCFRNVKPTLKLKSSNRCFVVVHANNGSLHLALIWHSSKRGTDTEYTLNSAL